MSEEVNSEKVDRRKWFKIAGAGVLAVAVGGAGAYYYTSQPEEDTINVLVESTMTGAYGWAGQHQIEGTALAVDEVNAAGGVLGKELRYTSIDDELNPSVATRRVNDAIEKSDIKLIVGGTSGGINYPVNEISKSKKIFYFIGNQSSYAIHKAEVLSPYTASPMCMDVNAVAVNMDYMIKNFGKKWYILTVDYAWGHGMLEMEKNWLQKFDGELVGEDQFPLGTTDFSSLLGKVKSAKPDVMACNSGGTDQLNWIKQSKEFGMMEEMTVHAPLTSMYTAIPAGAEIYADIICGTDFWYEIPQNYPGYQAAKEFREKYEGRFGAPPDAYGANPYVAVWEWSKAVNRAGTLDPDSIRKELENNEFQYYKAPEYWRACDLQAVQDWFLVKGKKPEDSKNKYDLFDVIGWGGRENPENYLPSCEELGF